MAYNVPSYETGRFTFGPGILYIGAAGTTPLTDIGAVKGDAEFTVERTKLEVLQGSPQTLIKSYAIKEDVKMKVNSIEWDLDNFAFVLGAGVTSANGAEEILEFGGSMDTQAYALRYVHRTADGGTIDIHVFNAEGMGSLAAALKEAEVHEFPYEFTALEGTVDFGNVALIDGKKKFKIIRTKV